MIIYRRETHQPTGIMGRDRGTFNGSTGVCVCVMAIIYLYTVSGHLTYSSYGKLPIDDLSFGAKASIRSSTAPIHVLHFHMYWPGLLLPFPFDLPFPGGL